MSLVSGTMEELRGYEYNPPVDPFGLESVTTTNTHDIALSNDGTSYLIQGMVVTTVEPVSYGHLITVTGYFTNWNLPYTVTLQNVLNSYSNPDE